MEKITSIWVSAKCSDLCFVEYFDKDKKMVAERDGYVPSFLNEGSDNDGDFLTLEIDVASGKILNWKKPTQKELKDSIDS